MNFAGIIAAESDPPGLQRDRWMTLIAQHHALAPLDDAPTTARIVADGAHIGTMSWSTSGANELDVHGALEAVTTIAAEIAVALGGRFVTLEELTSC